MKVYTIIGGVNGTGKSSLTGVLRAQRNDLGVIVDVDRITALAGVSPLEGGKMAIRRIDDCLDKGISFTQESTLSGFRTAQTAARAKRDGYTVRLFYVGLDTPEESLARIANRVKRGGHNIGTEDVLRRFAGRWEAVSKVLPYCDEAHFFDNDNGFVEVAEYKNGELLLVGLYNRDSFRREFGSWNKALEAADLLPTGFHRNIDKTELFANIEHLWIAKGRQPTVSDLQGNLSEYGPKAYFRVFGSWANALRTFAEYINHNDLADRGPSCFSEKTDSENASDSTITTDRMTLGNDSVKHQTVRTIGDRLRFKVLLRDNFKCRICGASPATDPTVVLHVDHVFPWSEGGETTIDNLQTLCSKCNYGKSNLIV